MEIFSKFASSTSGIVAFGAISGGVGAELTGGNFLARCGNWWYCEWVEYGDAS